MYPQSLRSFPDFHPFSKHHSLAKCLSVVSSFRRASLPCGVESALSLQAQSHAAAAMNSLMGELTMHVSSIGGMWDTAENARTYFVSTVMSNVAKVLPSHLMDVAKVIFDIKAANKDEMLLNTPFHAMADLDRACEQHSAFHYAMMRCCFG
eukprot:2421091-Pyramimonas_sp.AAC.1